MRGQTRTERFYAQHPRGGFGEWLNFDGRSRARRTVRGDEIVERVWREMKRNTDGLRFGGLFTVFETPGDVLGFIDELYGDVRACDAALVAEMYQCFTGGKHGHHQVL